MSKMNVSLTTSKETLSSEISKKDLQINYLKTNISSEPKFLTIDSGLPLKVDETNFITTSSCLPLGWHRGLLTEYYYREKNIYIYCIEFYDDDSCLLVDDRINSSFIANKRILYSISNFFPEEIKKMKNVKSVQDVKDQYKYEERIIELRC